MAALRRTLFALALTLCTARCGASVRPVAADATPRDAIPRIQDASSFDAQPRLDSGVDGASFDTALIDASRSDVVDATAQRDSAQRSTVMILGATDNASYSTARFRALLARRATVTQLFGATIDDVLLTDVRLLVVAHLSRVLADGERDALRRFITGPSRGRVLVISGYTFEQSIETNSVLQALSMRVETGTLLFTPPTRFADAAVSGRGLTEPLFINGAFVFDPLPANATPELFAEEPRGAVVAARYENGGRAFVLLDEWATFDGQLVNDNVVRFWDNVLDDLLR